jgi:hypothetical protein
LLSLKHIFIALIWGILGLSNVYSQVYVNEIMASHNGVFADEDGDFPDWIELYNASTEAVDISGWFLSDDNSELYKWKFGQCVIPATSFIIIWASGKNRQQNGIYHTNFQVKSGSELIILSNSSGEIVDELIAFEVIEGCSVGLKPDGSESESCLVQPSPHASNNDAEIILRAMNVEFSSHGGYYPSEFNLALSCEDAGATIIYTIDGSEPKLKNIGGATYKYKNEYPIMPGDLPGDFMTDTLKTFVYSTPIGIYDRSDEPDKLTHKSSTVTDPDYFPVEPVSKATVIRARAVKEGMLDSEIKTETFFVGSCNPSKFGLPVISLSVDADKLFDYYDGIYTAGIDFDNWRNRNPQEDYLWPYQGNFKRRGKDNEYLANIELYADGELFSVINQNIGIRINGVESRSFPMKSIRLCPSIAYGESHFNYPIINNLRDTVYDELVLYSGGNDSPWTGWEPELINRTLIRDVYIHQLVKGNGFGIREFRPAILFLNGELWGIHTIRENFSIDYFKRNFGINQTNLDLLSDNATVLSGSNFDYRNFLFKLADESFLSTEFMSYVDSEIDTKSFIDYVISEIFIHNTDWPSNNVMFYRNNIQPTDSASNNDGRWRWLFYDSDLAFGLCDLSNANYDNDFEYYFGNPNDYSLQEPWHNYLIRHLLNSADFKSAFINRFEFHLLNTFNPDVSLQLLDDIILQYNKAMPFHFERWGGSFYSFSGWENSINQMRIFAIERPCEIREMLKEYFDIQNPMYAFGVCDSDYFDSDNFCENVFVFPNPATDIITIKISQGKHYACKIDLYNSFGEVLMFKDYHVFDTELSFNISELPQAVYYIRIECGDLYCVKKIVKI